MKKSKRKKKKVKKISAESVSSRDVSHEVAASVNVKESILVDTSMDLTKGFRMENISASPVANAESNNMRSEKLRHTKGSRAKVPPTPQYLTRQQRMNCSIDETISVPKAASMRKSLVDSCRGFSRMILPALSDMVKFLYSSSLTIIRDILGGTALLLPSRERLWFVLPVLCFISDICFLILCVASSLIGKISYFLLMAHKLALSEISENPTAIMCYTISSSFPILGKPTR